MTAEPERCLRLTRRFEAAPERVFDAWLNPALARRRASRQPIEPRELAFPLPAFMGHLLLSVRCASPVAPGG